MPGLNPLKRLLKESLLDLGLYHKVNNFRFRNDARNKTQKAFYAGVIKEDDLVFDVGANVGQRSEIFAKLARRVVAIEPQPNCIRHLKSRFRFNRRVTVEPVAVGERAGEATMWQSRSPGISSMSRKFIDTMGQGVFKEETWDREIKVEIKTLDALIQAYGLPAFLKIDVEGYELSVLKGLTHPVPFISFEYAPEMIDQTRECAERIHEISSEYVFNFCRGEDLEFVLDEHVDHATLLGEIGRQNSFGDIYAILRSRRILPNQTGRSIDGGETSLRR